MTTTITHLEVGLARHASKAASAIKNHKDSIEGGTKRYDGLSQKFNKLMSLVSSEEQPSSRILTETDDLIQHASREWFDVSSDYQQDKSVPSRNPSPQPNSTFCMSGETHYVHILCVESCGETTGASCFSRNIVYTRSERVGGSKSSDDTLSTLADMLGGGSVVDMESPPVLRTGYGSDGALRTMYKRKV